MRKIFVFLAIGAIILQGLVSCKSEDILPSPSTNPNQKSITADTTLRQAVLFPVKMLKKIEIIGAELSDNEGQPGSDLVCTGLPVDNLILGCPWVDDSDTSFLWHPVIDPSPFVPKSIKHD